MNKQSCTVLKLRVIFQYFPAYVSLKAAKKLMKKYSSKIYAKWDKQDATLLYEILKYAPIIH